MKRSEWMDKIQGYNPEIDETYVVFAFQYAIRQTEKSILFKISDKLSNWVPKSMLRVDRQKTGYVFISDYIYRRVLNDNKKKVEW